MCVCGGVLFGGVRISRVGVKFVPVDAGVVSVGDADDNPASDD